MKSSRLRHILFGIILVSLFVCLINPFAIHLVESKKFKEKKLIKQFVKGFVLKNLSTRKNFLPLPVPIPVPIELNDPPVYVKGKPKYVTIYKPPPPPMPALTQNPKPAPSAVIKPTTVYHMPVYSPSYGYIIDPTSLYSSMMLTAAANPSYDVPTSTSFKYTAPGAYDDATLSGHFRDYDDEYGQYYVRKSPFRRATINRDDRANDDDVESEDDINNDGGQQQKKSGPIQILDKISNLQQSEEKESLDHEDRSHARTKRQVYYQSGYEGQKPCEGFPLEINVKSRIKLDRIFPIHGRSQLKKCIPVGKPLLPPVESPY